jgi:hypothetical protein
MRRIAVRASKPPVNASIYVMPGKVIYLHHREHFGLTPLVIDHKQHCELVQLVEVCRKGFQVIRLQSNGRHTAVGHSAIGCLK